jgi:hypothetical protein
MTAVPNANPLIVTPPREPLRVHLAVILGYLLLGVVWTWPLVPHFGTGVIQKGGLPIDAGQGVWNLWWTRSTLLMGDNPFVTQHLFFPLELNLFYQTLSLPNGLVAAPVLFGIGPVAAFNTVTLLSFALGGYAVYRLARGLGVGRLAALLAGFVFVGGAYHMQRIWSGPMELIAVQWLPLYLLLLCGALARPSVWRILGAGFALLVTTLASQYYGLYAAIYTGAHVALAALLVSRGERLRTFGVGVGVGVVWVATLLPLLLIAGGLDGAVLEDWYIRQVYHSVALIDLVAPNTRHPLWGTAAENWHAALHEFGPEGGASLGIGVMLLSGVALICDRRRAWPWVALAMLMLLFAMGPQLRLTGADSPIPGPFLLLDLFGPFRNSSRPSVFVALMLIPVAMLVALGLSVVGELAGGRNSGPWGGPMKPPLRRAVPALAAALVVGEALVAPWPITPLQAADRAALMANDPLPGAVFALPPRNNDSRNLIDQICHGRPLIGGYLARLPDYRLARYPSATRMLWNAETPADDILAFDPASELAALGVRFVTLDLTELPRGQAGRLRETLAAPGISLVSADEQAEVYAIDPQAVRAVAVLDEGWYDVERAAGRTWRWMGDTGVIGFISPQTTPVLVQFTATAYSGERTLQMYQGAALVTEIAVPTAPFARTLSLRLLLPPGQSTLTFMSSAELAADGRRLSLSISQLQVKPLPIAPEVDLPAAPPLPPQIPALRAPPCGASDN